MKIRKKMFVCFLFFFFFWGGGGVGLGVSGWMGTGNRSFCENSFFFIFFFFLGGGGSGWGDRVDVNREVKFLSKFKKEIEGGGGSR